MSHRGAPLPNLTEFRSKFGILDPHQGLALLDDRAFLDQDVVQVDLDRAPGLRPGRAGQIPRPVGELRQRDPRPHGADAPEAQLRSDERNAAARTRGEVATVFR